MLHNKKIIFALLALLPSSIAIAEESSGAATQSGIDESMIMFYFALGLGVFILLVLVFMVRKLNQLYQFLHPSTNSETTTIFKLVDGVPIEREHEIIFAHEYDGIRELDNKMPAWWLYMFYITIGFSVIYMWYYHVSGDGNIQAKEYVSEIKRAEAEMKLLADKVNETNVTALTDLVKIKKGEEVYAKNCVACHGTKGEGGVGPNLTDEYWLHGGDVKSIFKTIKYGVPAKGMIPWQTQLGASQMQELSSFILTLKGTNPPNAKAPQGEKM